MSVPVHKQRRGTAAAMAAANELPADGQIYYERDTNRVKIGDGVRRYNDLPYLDAKAISQIEGLQAALDSKSNIGHTHALDDLSDVDISQQTPSESVLLYTGQYWSTSQSVGRLLVGSETLAGWPAGSVGEAIANAATASSVSALSNVVDGVVQSYVSINGLSSILTNNYYTNTETDTLLAGKQATGDYIVEGDSRLTNAREWTGSTVPQAEAEDGTATTRRAWTAQRVFQAIAAWWNGSAAAQKLEGIATGATANATDAALRDRQTHTGEQAISTVTGLQGALDGKSSVGHTHALNDLSDVSASSSFDNPLLDNYILTYDQASATWRHTNKGGYIPVGSIPLGGYPSGTIGAALAGKVNTTDARLTDARSPTSHAASHAAGQADAITPAAIGAQPAGDYIVEGDSRLTDARLPTTHYHDAAGITSGVLNIARIPTGTTSTTVCIGNDSRLSDARSPLAHAASHAAGQADAITPASIGAQPAGNYVTDGDARLTDERTPLTASVTTAKIANGAVTESKIADSSVTLNKLAADAAAELASKAPLANPNFTGTVSGVTKAMVGLGNVDNTSDAAKPISTATQTALNGKASAAHTHAASDITSGTLGIARIPTGSTSTTVCIGNDTRLSNARTPTSHAASHASGQADAITPASIGAAAATHTHALSSLQQSGATTGQVVTWNGTAWVADDASGGGSGTGLTPYGATLLFR